MDKPSLPIPLPPPPHPDTALLAQGIGRCVPLATRLTGISDRVASVGRATPGDLIAGVGSSAPRLPAVARLRPWTRPASRTSARTSPCNWPYPWY
jgi:hypothetical protein